MNLPDFLTARTRPRASVEPAEAASLSVAYHLPSSRRSWTPPISTTAYVSVEEPSAWEGRPWAGAADVEGSAVAVAVVGL